MCLNKKKSKIDDHHGEWVSNCDTSIHTQIKTIGKSHALIISFQLSFLLHKLKRLTTETNKVRKGKNVPIILSRFEYGYTDKMLNCLRYPHCSTRFDFFFFISCLDTVTHSLSNSRNRNAKADEKFIVFWPRQWEKRTYEMRSLVRSCMEQMKI